MLFLQKEQRSSGESDVCVVYLRAIVYEESKKRRASKLSSTKLTDTDPELTDRRRKGSLRGWERI